ncbi:MAG: topoisomerase DNA-binding C4 zinc finger domain-containing protein [Myxococcales bacterium]|nr:topoisomerase DNA-binding C4 zinc finger domain-containing protein [Myxococcales bacterium]
MSSSILTVHISGSAVPVAACLKRYFAMRGYAPVPRSSDDPPVAEFVVIAAPPGGYVTIVPDPPDQCEDTVVAYLSQQLRSRSYLVLLGDASAMAKRFDSGTETASATLTPNDFVSTGDPSLGALLKSPNGPQAGLETLGLRYLTLGTVDPKSVIRLGFAATGRRAAGALVIDPLLQCPFCRHPMIERVGPRGRFFGCSQFPSCKGMLTEAQANKQRKVSGL